MNRIYKVIWNEALSCFTAVGEYAKSRGKSSKSSVSANATINTTSNLSSTRFFRMSTIGLGLIAAGLTMSPQVFAATGVGGGVEIGTASNCSTAASAGGDDSVAVGCGSVADSDDTGITFYDRENPYHTTVDTTSGRYYSVAVGTDATALEAGTSVGMRAESGELGVAFGAQAKSQDVAAIAIGPAALATGNTSLALGRQSAATADFAQAIGNVSAATGLGSLAMGHSATAEGSRSIAIGSADIGNAGSTGDQAGVKYQTAEQTLSTGKDAIALGAAAKSTKDYALAIGAFSQSKGERSVAIGSGAKATADNAVVIGDGADTSVAGGVALGLNSKVTGANSVSIGQSSVAAAQSGMSFLTNVNASSTDGTVSVGNGTTKRRMSNLADGALNSDAVTVAQLKKQNELVVTNQGDITTNQGAITTNQGAITTNQGAITTNQGAITTNRQDIDRGLDFTGDNNTVTITRKFGEKLTVKGGATTALSSGNIGVVADNSANTLTVKLAKNLTGLTSVTTGNTVMSNSGITFSGGSSVSLSNNGLNNGGNQITKVGSAGDLTNVNNANNAVNVSDLNNFGSSLGQVNVAAGTNVDNISSSTNGNLTTYTVNADGASVSSADVNALTVTGTKDTTTKVTDYQVDLGDKTKTSLSSADSAMQTLITQVDGTADKTLTKTDNKANFASGDNILLTRETDGSIKVATKEDVKFKKVTVTDGADSSVVEATKIMVGGANPVTIDGAAGTVKGLTNTTWNGTSIVSGQAATEDQLKLASTALVNKGMKFVGNDAQIISRTLGETLGIEGGLTTGTSSAANIKTVKRNNGTLEIQMAKNLTDIDSLNINNGGPIISSSGIDMGSNVDQEGNPTNRITNLGTGIDDTDAVNVKQLNEVNATANKGWFVRTDSGDGAKSNVKPEDVVTINGDSNNISVTNTGNDLIVALDDDLSVGGSGTDGVIGVNGADGVSGVAINGADGSIGLTGAAGIDGVSPTLTMRPEIQPGDVFDDGTDVTRLSYQDGEGNSRTMATLEDDGLRFSGNDNPSAGYVTRNLNNEMQIVGSKTTLGSYSSGNINTVATQEGGIEIQLADSPKFGEVIINAENNGKITGVTAGEDDTDAVNVKQLNQAGTELTKLGLDFGGDSGIDVKRKLGQKLTVKGGDTINADPATKNISVTANGADTLTVRLDKDINLGSMGSMTTGNTQVNNAGVTLYNGSNNQVALTNNGLDNGDNQLTGVADGALTAGSKDAVNGSQLYQTNQEIAKGVKFELNGDTKTYALGEAIQVATDANITTTAFGNGAKFGLADSIKIGGASPNAVSIDGTAGTIKGLSNTTFDATATYSGGQAATQEQLSDLQGGINSTFNQGLTFGGDSGVDVNRKLGDRIVVQGGVSDPTALTNSNIGVIANGANTLSIKLAKNLTGLDSAAFGSDVMISDTGFRAGKTLVNQDGVTFINAADSDNELSADSTVMLSSMGLNNGGNKIVNVAKGEALTDAVNLEQLNEVKQSAAAANQGWGLSAQGDTATTTTVKPSATVDLNNTDGNITVAKTADDNDVSFNLNKDLTVDSIQTGAVMMSDDGLVIAGGPKVTKTGIDAGGNTILNVANGLVDVDSKEAINGGQLDEVIAAFENSTSLLAAEAGAGLDFSADSGSIINKTSGSTPLSLTGGNNITTTADGSNIQFDLNGNIDIDSISTGNTTVNNDGVRINDGPSMTTDGINAAGQKITNVADGTTPRDAVNFGQLDAVTKRLGDNMNQLGYKIGEVEDDANAGISAAMAMSSLPQAYIAGKSLIGGGIGTYNGESAVAIGFSKLSDNGRWVMKLNGTADTQGNAGASIGAGFHFD